MFSRIEIMQMLQFPAKLSTRREIAEINADHAHHDHMEKEFDVLYRLKSAYAELWYLQQSIALTHRNGSLLLDALAAARARYGTGSAGEEAVLKASLESARNDNLIVSLRQRELAMKSMIMAILDRPEGIRSGSPSCPIRSFSTSLSTRSWFGEWSTGRCSSMIRSLFSNRRPFFPQPGRNTFLISESASST
jgi:outer membrane protein TolC